MIFCTCFSAFSQEMVPVTAGAKQKTGDEIESAGEYLPWKVDEGDAGVDEEAVHEEARIHWRQGVILFEEDDYEAALVEFRKAWELRPSYKILYNIGQVEFLLKHYARALEAFEKYIEDGADEIEQGRRDEVVKEIETLRLRTGWIGVTRPLSGADIFLDEALIGQADPENPFVVDIGFHLVEIVRNGKSLFRQKIEIAAGETIKIGPEEKSAVKAGPEPLPDNTADAGTEDEKAEEKMVFRRTGFGFMQGIGVSVCSGDIPCGGSSAGVGLDLSLYYRFWEYMSADLGLMLGVNSSKSTTDITDTGGTGFWGAAPDTLPWIGLLAGLRGFFMDEGRWDPYAGLHGGLVWTGWSSNLQIKDAVFDPVNGSYMQDDSGEYLAGAADFTMMGAAFDIDVGLNLFLWKGLALNLDVRGIFSFWQRACASYNYSEVDVFDADDVYQGRSPIKDDSSECSEPSDVFPDFNSFTMYLIGTLNFSYTF